MDKNHLQVSRQKWPLYPNIAEKCILFQQSCLPQSNSLPRFSVKKRRAYRCNLPYSSPCCSYEFPDNPPSGQLNGLKNLARFYKRYSSLSHSVQVASHQIFRQTVGDFLRPTDDNHFRFPVL